MLPVLLHGNFDIYQSNKHLVELGFQPTNNGRQVLLNYYMYIET